MDGNSADVDIVTSENGQRHEFHRHYHGHLTAKEREEVREAVRNARAEVHEAMKNVRPQIEHAMVELKAHRAELEKVRPEVERAMREARPQIEKAIAEARAAMAKAHLDVKVQEHVDRALQRAELRIEAHERHMDHDRVIMEHESGDHDRDMHGDHDRDMDGDHDSDDNENDSDNDKNDNDNSPR
jgi:hypothetical protein